MDVSLGACSLLLQTGITSSQHALLLLESVIQKKGRLVSIERVVAEMLQFVGPCTDEAGGVLKVAAGQSSSQVVAMLVDWSHRDRQGLDLQLLGLALAEACDCKNDEVMHLILSCWRGKCTSTQAQPLLRAFAARGDASTVERLLSHGKTAMVQMDTKARAALAGSGLSHAAGEGACRKQVLSTLLQAGADPKGVDGETALRNAARDGRAESMRLLLGVGTNVNAVDEDGKTVLCVAACSGCTETVQVLLQHGAQVRMRCHDGREPLDFAADESVRQLLLAEVEKLRMGLLDELLADEEDDKSKKNGKKKGKKGKEGSGQNGGSSATPTPTPAVNNGSAPPAKAGGGDAAAGAAAEGGGEEPSKNAKKKQKKKAAAAEAEAAAAAAAAEAGDKTGAAPAISIESHGDGGHSIADVIAASNGTDGGAGGGAARSPASKKKGAKAASPLANGHKPSPSLLEAVGQVLRTQTSGPSMRLSALISALYELDTDFKEEIKTAGGAKTWLRIHEDEFELDTDCAPGNESVSLRMPLPPPPSGGAGGGAGARGGSDWPSSPPESPQRGRRGGRGDDLSLPSPLPGLPGLPPPPSAHLPLAPNASLRSTLRDRLTMPNERDDHDDDYEPGVDSPPRHLSVDEGPDGAAGRAAAEAADDDAAAAALLGAASDLNDPLLIEKKIRAVQKKLRRVQTIEQGPQKDIDSAQQVRPQLPPRLVPPLHAPRACSLVPPLPPLVPPLPTRASPPCMSQVLLASKPRLQAGLAGLLQQWAVLEPALLEQQQQKMLAIANSECAICLEEYTTEEPGIRTSCCGYHFHHSCLQQCIDSTGHCPICSAPRGSCKVVQQRRPATAPAVAS